MAEDPKLFKSIFSDTDQELIQKGLLQVKAWSDNNLLKLCPEKCVQMRIGKSKTPDIYSACRHIIAPTQ